MKLASITAVFFLTSCGIPAAKNNGQSPDDSVAPIKQEVSQTEASATADEGSATGASSASNRIRQAEVVERLHQESSKETRSLKAVGPTCDLVALRRLKNTEADAAPILKACIEATPVGGTFGIPYGTYTLHSYLTVNRGITLTTAGVNVLSPECDLTNSCAVLQAAKTMNGVIGKDPVGFLFKISGNKTTIHHLVFDSRKQLRSDRDKALCATNGLIGWVGNWETCTDCTFTKNVVKNALCSSNFVVGNAIRSTITHSTFSNAGTHGSRVADGLTILKASDSNISVNKFSNNSDIDLIFGECPRCMIQLNRVTHYDNPNGDPWLSNAFVGILIFAWPGTSGDYTGAILRDNYIDGGPDKSLGQGLTFGMDPALSPFVPDPAMIAIGWKYPPRPVRGFTAYRNFVTNAKGGITISPDVRDATMGDNFASGSTGDIRCQGAGGVMGDYYSYVATKGSNVVFQPENLVGKAFYANFADAGVLDSYAVNAPRCVPKSTNLLPAPNAMGASPIFTYITHSIYQQYLGRRAEPQALVNARQQFASGALTELDLRNSVIRSDEYCRRWLRGQYQEFLGRLPEKGAYGNWCDPIVSGRASHDDVRTAIKNSDEAVSKRGR